MSDLHPKFGCVTYILSSKNIHALALADIAFNDSTKIAVYPNCLDVMDTLSRLQTVWAHCVATMAPHHDPPLLST
ncbi:hypothetical protein XBI1_1120005 [Xenorhabdus bovienii str. Intermedium]|uniref:Uncharacterized protein n=1 Tax=Xenorhabdus bovienii str. Intermedium TaxID=1379677 RepID=A0A077Q3U9_XENBV|nr:hypothetical protein XBI1_1120005 [Xenorhabdus bovienii str. Intermedium]